MQAVPGPTAASGTPGGNWADLVLGFTRSDPPAAPGSLKTAFLLWRITVFLVPVTALLIGLFIADAGAQMRNEAQTMLDDPFLILITFGMILIFAAILWLFGAILGFVAILSLVIAVPLGLLFNLALGRTLRGANRSAAPGLWAMIGAAVTALLTAAPLLAILSSWTGSEALGMTTAAMVLGIPFVGFILLAKRTNRSYLRVRHAQARPPQWIRVGGSEAAPWVDQTRR